jgi:transcriptional regulator with XRE-family HTH domain
MNQIPDTVAWRRVFHPGRKGTAMLDPTLAGPSGRGRRPRPLLRTMLGDVLRRTRREQGRTLADVARAAKVSMPYLSEVERGRKEASSEVLAAICESLGIDLSDLLADVWRDLAEFRTRRGRFERAAQAQPAEPSQSAQSAQPVQRAERVIQLDTIRGGRPAVPAPQRQGAGATPQCLLAA